MLKDPGPGEDKMLVLLRADGQTGAANPNRQGLNSALRGEGDPLNVQQEIPGQGNGRYSPIWDVHPSPGPRPPSTPASGSC